MVVELLKNSGDACWTEYGIDVTCMVSTLALPRSCSN